MDYKLEQKNMAGGKFRPVYIIDTPELFYRSEFLNTLVKAFFGTGSSNLNTFRGREAAADEVIHEISSSSLFAPRQIVRVVDAVAFLSSTSRHSSVMNWFSEFLAGIAGESDPASILLLEDDSGQYGRNKKYADALKEVRKLGKKLDLFVKVPEIKKYKLPAWITDRSRERHGIKLGANEARLILDNTGEDLMRIDMELDKIATFVFPRKQITVKDITELTLFDRENTIFEMLDALSVQDADKVLVHMRQLLTSGTPAMRILYMIFWHIKRLLRGRLWRDQGQTPAYIAAQLNIASYFVEKFTSQVMSFTAGRLTRYIKAVEKADLLSKTGADDVRTLERLLLALCGPEKNVDLAFALT